MDRSNSKIKTYEAVFAWLEMQRFKFESVKQLHDEKNLRNICKCFDACKTGNLENTFYYRARRIYPGSDGIRFCDGIPQNGFDSKQSGVAPAQQCKVGRANDVCEQVLYVAEDIKTALEEVRTPIGEYASIATCIFDKPVKVFDFSPYSKQELREYVETSNLCIRNEYISLFWMYTEMQQMLTLPDYSEDEYIVSRELVRIIKDRYPSISGIVYASQFTGKKNVAIWDDNKFVSFSQGKVMINEEH